MITLFQPEKVNSKGNVRLQAKFELSGNENVLWYETSEKYGSYMTSERSDAFLVGLLWLALRNGEDIKVIGPLSEKLFYTLNYHLIPFLAQLYKYKQIKVLCDNLVSTPLPNAGAVGTGLSCGIDSLSTICSHQEEPVPSNYQISHLTFFNVGSNEMMGRSKWREKMFNDRAALSAACAKELGKELIIVDSNLNDILQMSFVRTHTLRNISALLVFQKLFNKYYYSSGYQTTKLKYNYDAASYDVISLPLLSTENVTFLSFGGNFTRVQKTQMVANMEISYKYLNVCLTNIHNCGRCLKCKRTLLTLEVLGAIDKYRHIFNLDAYFKERDSYLLEVIQSRGSDPLFKEIYDEMVRTKFLSKRKNSNPPRT
jgi:hypothetical protein